MATVPSSGRANSSLRTAGDWENYIKAAAQAVEGKWKMLYGIDAAVTGDLPPAAGLSSSSALLVAFTLALLRANGVEASFEELMEVLPEGEYFVGTRGGGMDHAAVLGCRAGMRAAHSLRSRLGRVDPHPVGLGFPGGAQSHHRRKVGGGARGVQLAPHRRVREPWRNWGFARITRPSMGAPSRICASLPQG